MSKVVKEMLMSEMLGRLGETRDMLVINSSKLDGVTANRFRLALRAKNITLLTVRNSLAKRALHGAGLTALDKFLEGPSTLVWGSEDIVALSKEIAKWAKELQHLEIKGGAVEGTPVNAQEVDALSKSPSREELIGRIVSQILGPGSQLSAALLGPGAKLASQIKKIAEKDESPEEAPAAA
jgi:large subunit ribosomal protein L10